jgi:hypothetical protein
MCDHAYCFYIASTLPDCCSDGRFEDFPGDFDGFQAFVLQLAACGGLLHVFLFPLLATRTVVS